MHVRSNTRKVSDPRKVFRHTRKFQIHVKIQTHTKIWTQQKTYWPTTKIYRPLQPTRPTQILTIATHAPTHPRTHRTHTTHKPMQPTQFSRLHSIITKVHKIICFTHTKMSTLVIFFWSSPKFCGPTRSTRSMPKFDSHHSRTYAPTLSTPPKLFSRLVKLM